MRFPEPLPMTRKSHELRLAAVGNGPPKPIRRRRADRQEIDWYGFAAQGDGRALLMGLAADRPTLYRTKDPAHSVTPRQQRYLAVRGACSMLEHRTFLSWSGRSGCPTSVSPYGGPRVRIRLPPAASPLRTPIRPETIARALRVEKVGVKRLAKKAGLADSTVTAVVNGSEAVSGEDPTAIVRRHRTVDLFSHV
jgi:hypothetical protein